MKTRILGDIHGKFRNYTVLTESVPQSIQIGDFGFGFNPEWDEHVIEWHSEKPQHRFIRGNHDDPAQCKKSSGYVPDGMVEGEVMYIGGAWSIDSAFRTAGVNWWPDEECSIEQYYQFIDTYRMVKPRVMITHDAPTSVTDEMFIKTGLAIGGSHARSIKTLTGTGLQAMFEEHQPEFWFFGHWHHTISKNVNGTKFQCIGECNFIDFDFEKMENVK